MSETLTWYLENLHGCGKLSYQRPSCKVITIVSENLFCASVTPNGQTSHEQGWGAEETHETEIILGDDEEVAPAKPGLFLGEE